MLFGKGSYWLSEINTKEGPRPQDEVANIRELLTFPPGDDNEYLIKALLFRAYYQLKDYASRFAIQYEKFKLGTYNEAISIPKEADFLVLQLDTFEALHASKVFPNKLFCVELRSNNQHAGYVYFANQEVTIFSKNDLKISGVKDIRSVFVNSLADVKVDNPLHLSKSLRVFALSFQAVSSRQEPLIKAQSMELVLAQQCLIDGITCIGYGQIKAGECQITREMECQRDLVIFTEQAQIKNSLCVKNKLILFCMDCESTALSHIHAAEMQLFAANQIHLNGQVSTNHFQLDVYTIEISSTIYLDGPSKIRARGMGASNETTKTAIVYHNKGDLIIQSDNIASYAGTLVYQKNLCVAWKKIIDPSLTLTQAQQQQLSEYGRITYDLEEKYAPLRVPYIEGQSEQPLPVNKSSDSQSHVISINAPYLYLSGTFVLGTDACFSGEQDLSFTGSLWDASLFASKNLILQAKKHLSVLNARMQSSAAMLLNAQNLTLSNANLQAKQIGLKATNLVVEQDTSLRAKHIGIKVEERIHIPPKTHLKLIAEEQVVIFCKELECAGDLEFNSLMIKATENLRFFGAALQGQHIMLDCKYLIAGLSRFLTQKMTITCLGNFQAFCQVASTRYTNSSIFNCSMSLFTLSDASLNKESALGLLLALTNTSLSILHLVIPDPTVQAGLMVGRLGINTIPAAFGVAQLAQNIYQSAKAPLDRSGLIRLANQVKSLVFSTAGLVSTGVHDADTLMLEHLPVNPANFESVLSTLNEVNKALAPLVALMQPGKRVDSFVSIHSDFNAGLISNSETSCVIINQDTRIELSDSIQTVASLDPNPLAFNLVPNASEMGIVNVSYQTKSILPSAACSQLYVDMYASSPFNVAEEGMSIETLRYHTDGTSHLNGSTLKAKTVIGTVGLHNSSISAKTWINDEGLIIDINHSNAEVETIIIPEKSTLKADSSHLKIKNFIQDGKAELNAVQAEIETWDYRKDAEALTYASDVKVGHMRLPEKTSFQGISSKLEIQEVRGAGTFVVDAHSDVKGHQFDLSGPVASRASNWKVDEFTHPESFKLELDSQATCQPGIKKPFEYTTTCTLKSAFHFGTVPELSYGADTPINISNEEITSKVPITIVSPASVNLSGNNHTNVPITIISDTITEANANDTFDSSLKLFYNTYKSSNSNTQVHGDATLKGQNGSIYGGSFRAHGKIDIESNLTVQGKVIQNPPKVTQRHGHFNKKKEVEVIPAFENAALTSDTGVYVMGHDLDFTGADVISPDTNLISDKHINMDPLLATHSKTTSSSNWFRGSHTSFSETLQSPSHIIGTQHLNIIGNAVTINGTDLVSANMYINANHLTATVPILGTTYNHSTSGFLFAWPELPSLTSLPGVSALKQLNQAGNLISTVSGLVNVTGTATNTLAAVLEDIKNKNVLSGAQDLTGFSPKATVSWNHVNAHYKAEHTGEGGFYAGNLIIDVHDAHFENDFPLFASSNAIIRSDLFSYSSAPLHFENDNSSLSLSDALGLNGWDIGLNSSGNHNHVTTHQGGKNFLNHLDVDIKKMILDGEALRFNTLSGHVGTFDSSSSIDELNQSSFGFNLDSNGNVSFHNGRHQAQTLSNLHPFISEQGPLSEATKDFSIDHMKLYGQQNEGIRVAFTEAHPICVYDVANSFGVNGHLPYAFGNWHPSGSVVTLPSAHYSYHNNQGLSDGSLIHKTKQDYFITIPIYDSANGKKLLQQLQEFSRHDKTVSPPIAKITPDHFISQKHSTEETHQSTPKKSPAPIAIDLANSYTASEILDPAVIFSLEPTKHQPHKPDKALFRPGIILRKPSDLSGKTETVYRGDATDEHEVFDRGIDARGLNAELLSHAMPVGKEYLADSFFISTSLDREVAKTFPQVPPEKGYSNVFKIVSERSVINPAAELVPKMHAGLIDPEDFEIYRQEQERAFTSKIFPYEIQGAWKVSITKEKVDLPGDFSCLIRDPSPGFLDEMRYTWHRTLEEAFIPNPNFISPSVIHSLWGTAKVLGHSLNIIGLGLDGTSLYRELQQSLTTKSYGNTYHEGARIAGGWPGAWSVGSLFARAGLLDCAPLTPYGQAACALGFGLVGSSIGYLGGSLTATKIYDIATKYHEEVIPSLFEAKTTPAFFKPHNFNTSAYPSSRIELMEQPQQYKIPFSSHEEKQDSSAEDQPFHFGYDPSDLAKSLEEKASHLELAQFKPIINQAENEFSFSMGGVHFFKKSAHTFYGVSALLNAFSIWKAKSVEDVLHVGYDLQAGSIGWDSAVVGLTACAGFLAFTPELFAVILTGATGGLISNYCANLLWDNGMEPFKENSSLLPFTLFNPNKGTPWLIAENIKKNHCPLFINGI